MSVACAEMVLWFFVCRVFIEHTADAVTSNLHIKSVQVPDEDVYVCETTFLEPLDTCTNDGTFSVQLLINGE